MFDVCTFYEPVRAVMEPFTNDACFNYVPGVVQARTMADPCTNQRMAHAHIVYVPRLHGEWTMLERSMNHTWSDDVPFRDGPHTNVERQLHHI